MNKKFLIGSGILLLLATGFLAGYLLSGDRMQKGMSMTAADNEHGHSEEETRYTCGMHPFVIQDEPGNCPICGMELTPLKSTGDKVATPASGERKIKYWAAPMDPTYIRDEPGKSPMGMDLIPVYEDEVAQGTTVTIDPVTIQNMGVRTATVTRRDIARTISTVGLVGYDETRQYSVNSKIMGWVERLYINETGQKVKKGEPLLEIYSPELVSAQEEYLLALAGYERTSGSSVTALADSSKRLLDASKRRLQLWDISSRAIERLEKTRQVQKNMTLYAPYSGIITMKMVNEGELVKSGMELFKIADLSTIWVYADIYENELPWVEVGQEAKIRLPFAGGKTLSAKISYIYPYVEPKTRTVKARLELANPGFELKPDMYVNVRIKGSEVRDVLTVPVEAVINSGEKKIVFAALGDGRFEPRQIKVGMQDEEGSMQIVQGVLEGERVVTSAQFLFDSESRLREAIQKMRQPESEPEDHAEQDMEDPSATTLQEEELEDLFK